MCSGLLGHAASFLRRWWGGAVATDNQPEDSTSRAGNSASRTGESSSRTEEGSSETPSTKNPFLSINLASTDGNGDNDEGLFQKADRIWSNLDSLVPTDIYLYHRDYWDYDFWVSASCRGTRCTYEYDEEEVSASISPEQPSRNTTHSWTYNTIPFERFYYTGSPNTWSVWSVMDYSFFQSIIDLDSSSEYSARFSAAAGDLTGSRPSIRGTYNGAATAVTTWNHDFYHADVTLEYQDGELDVMFGDFWNVEDNEDAGWSIAPFKDVEVSSLGTFWKVYDDGHIWGNFFGPSSEEATGVFEDWYQDEEGQNWDVIGAFGTKRAR